MIVQAIIVVSGKVQSVGYREYVYRQAVRLGLTGMVRNIDRGKVWIVCEGGKEPVKEFIRDIEVQDSLAKVSGIKTEYRKPRGCYDTFLVARDLRYNGLPEKKLETGIGYLSAIHSELKGMRRELRSDSRLTRKELKNEMHRGFGKIDRMDVHTNRSFKRLDHKYGEFGKTMKGVARDIKGIRKTASAVILQPNKAPRKVAIRQKVAVRA